MDYLYKTVTKSQKYTPLWWSSLAGQLDVVRYHIEHGADINSTCHGGITPVLAACIMLWVDHERTYEIVKYLVEHNADILKADYTGCTCLMKSVECLSLCEFLIDHGADVNAQNLQLQTALHLAILEHRNETVKCLLRNGADPFIKDESGLDAIKLACLKHNTEIITYLCQNYKYSKQSTAEAYELLGSTFLDGHRNVTSCIYYWEIALAIRYSDLNNVIEKKYVTKPQKSVIKTPYEYITEFNSYEELENLSVDDMYIQSLLVCERILGSDHDEFIERLMFRGSKYIHSENYCFAINLLMYGVELQIQKETLFCSKVSDYALSLVALFSDLMFVKHWPVKFNDVYELMYMLIYNFKTNGYLLNVRPIFKIQLDNFHQILKTLIIGIKLLNKLEKTPDQIIAMKQLIKEIIILNPRNSGGNTILHLTVSQSFVYHKDSEKLAIVELLLESGASVDILNHNLSSPLHIAAQKSNFIPEVVNTLLKYGAHIDNRNVQGDSPYDLLKNISQYNFKPLQYITLNFKPLQYITLKCLAARKVRESGITFIGQIPVHLENYISIH